MTGKHSYEHVEVLKEDAGYEEDVTYFFVAFENSMGSSDMDFEESASESLDISTLISNLEQRCRLLSLHLKGRKRAEHL